MKKTIIVLTLAALMSGCATHPDKMRTASVSPIQYKDYDCDQIGAELARVSRRSNELYNSLKKTADGDSMQMAVGMVLFWPALFFLEGGDGPEAAEYTRLKGEWDTLEQVAIQKKCAIDLPKRPAPEPPPAEDEQKKKEEEHAAAIHPGRALARTL